MKKILVILILCLGTGMPSWAVYNLTASNVSIADCSDKQPNYYFEITASTTQATYHVCLDVWPTQASIVGSFSTDNGTITRGFSSLRKGSSTYYYMYDDCPISLTIAKINNDTCELSAHFKAARGEDETRYEYDIAPFRFAYKAGDTPDDPTLDPYRFEPATPTTQTFEGQVVKVNDYRSTSGCINIHLIDSVKQLDWVELNLVTTTYKMPVGTYTFSTDSASNTLVASPGYRQHDDQPSYVALRSTEWGQYTPLLHSRRQSDFLAQHYRRHSRYLRLRHDPTRVHLCHRRIGLQPPLYTSYTTRGERTEYRLGGNHLCGRSRGQA